MDYKYEYIKLKARYKRMENMYRNQLSRANQQTIDLFKKLSVQPQLAQFDIELVDLVKQVSYITFVSQQDIIGKCRKKEYVVARQVFCYFARVHMKKTFVSIGAFLGCDHSTVIHHCKKMTDYLELKYQPETNYLTELQNNVRTYHEEAERISTYFS